MSSDGATAIVHVTPNGPTDWGEFGPNTSGTTTNGIQEAINASPEQGVIMVSNSIQLPTSTTVVINKNVTLMSESSGNPLFSHNQPYLNEPYIGRLIISDAKEIIWAARIRGLGMYSLAFSASTSFITGTLLEDCAIGYGITYNTGSGIVCDQTVYSRCSINNYTPGATATVTVTGTGSNNVNQTFFTNGTAISFPGTPTSGNLYMFEIINANFYPVISGCGLYFNQTLTSGTGTIFKMKGSGNDLVLFANVGPNYSEYHSPIQIIEALSADITPNDYWIYLDWNCSMNAPFGLNVMNVTYETEEDSFINVSSHVTGVSSSGTFSWGTNNAAGFSNFPVRIHVPYYPNCGWLMSGPQLPAVPGGTGSSHKVTNNFTQKATIYPGSATSGLHIIDSMGNDTLVDNPSIGTFELWPSEACYFATTAPTAWKWYGQL